ncbi:hypothetical protein GCM10010176_062480 [Nonomuraea spiralis]|nr:hypothetical protein GCM10010176_062480 [Nonomuraea spiralis]
MKREPQEPDPNQTVRHRLPHPEQPPPPPQGPPEAPYTQRLPYTPDMLPDVPLYETRPPPKSAWWWVVLVGGLLLLVAAVAVATVLWVRGQAS